MKIQVLDHGYVELIECWGTGKAGALTSEVADCTTAPNIPDFECGIIEAARQSTQGAFKGWEPTPCSCDSTPHQSSCTYQPGDKKLLRYLYEHNHSSPFEFAGMVIEVQAPIFVFREWQRHRTQSYNEMSARYAPLPDLYYVPDVDNIVERVKAAATTRNKQAASTITVDADPQPLAEIAVNNIRQRYAECESSYQLLLDMGMPRELARVVMPVGHYSRMRAAANLRNWLSFMTLRCDPNAQWEIQQFAWAVAELICVKFPRTYELWREEEWPT